MKYTKSGKSGLEISRVSMGVLQIPDAADPESINPEERAAALRRGIDLGVNYINLGFPYYFDDKEKACSYVRQALEDGYRERVQLAVNIPAALVSSREDMDAFLNDQLRWYGIESADVCIISGIYRGNWSKLKKLGLGQWLDSVLNTGKARYAGFSFHDDPHFITPINSCYDKWALIQVDYSFMDERHHPGDGGIDTAAGHGLAVVASECLKGGRLVKNIPESVQEIWDKAGGELSPAGWAIKWVCNNASVSSLQFDFASPAEAESYISCADRFEPDSMTLEELLTVRSAVNAYEERRFFSCPACRCCMPCFRNVDAPRIGELYNEVCMFGDTKIPLFRYRLEGGGSPECADCGKCVSLCPRKNPLPEAFRRMKKLSEA